MANTFEKIATITVGAGGSSTIDITGIPSSFTDICIKLSMRTAQAHPFDNIYMSINGSSANYTLNWLGRAGTTAAAYGRTSFGNNMVAYVPGANAYSTYFANTEIYIPNYAGSNNKAIWTAGANSDDSSTTYYGISGGLWAQTTAINRLTFSAGSAANFIQNTTATIYGIK